MKFFLFLFIFLIGLNSKASEIFENFYSTRALGMGNAFSAVVDDQEALWFNPAALDKIRGYHFTLLGLQLGTDAVDSYTSYTNVSGSNYATTIRNFYGKQLWVGLSDTLGFSMKGFAIAGYDIANISFNLHNPAYTNVTVNLTNDVGFVGGFGVGLIPEILRIGVAVKRVTRYGGRIPFGPGTLASLSNTYINSLVNNIGTGYGLDLGILLEAPGGIHPAFAAVWHDVGQTKFIPFAGSNAPPVMDNEAVAGLSCMFDAVILKVRPAIDYKHINLQEEALGKKIHFGVEFEFPALSIRAGANQGYYTAGATIDFKYLKFEAATYGAELGVYPGQTEDRRYMANFTIDLNANPEFSLGDASSQKRPKAFQRR